MNLRVGIVGLRRGACFIGCFEKADENISVTAFCDTDESLLKKISEGKKDIKVFTKYEEFLKSDLDIVVVAVPPPMHADFSIAALNAGKHVLSEVPPVNSLKETEKLVEAVKKSKKKYMLAQNTCYWPHIQAWKKIVKDGRIGQIMYAEAEYIHDLRNLITQQIEEGNPWRAKLPPIYYCTHSLGPLLTIMEDRCILAQGFKTEQTLYIHNSKKAAPKMEVGIFKTEKGAVIKILVGFGMAKKSSHHHYYSIYGDKGCLETSRTGEEKTLAYFDDIPGLSDMISIPLSSKYRDIHIEGTHGGAEFFMVKDFIDSVMYDKPSPIGVEKALSFSLPGICAHRSAVNNGGVIEIPIF